MYCVCTCSATLQLLCWTVRLGHLGGIAHLSFSAYLEVHAGSPALPELAVLMSLPSWTAAVVALSVVGMQLHLPAGPAVPAVAAALQRLVHVAVLAAVCGIALAEQQWPLVAASTQQMVRQQAAVAAAAVEGHVLSLPAAGDCQDAPRSVGCSVCQAQETDWSDTLRRVTTGTPRSVCNIE